MGKAVRVRSHSPRYSKMNCLKCREHAPKDADSEGVKLTRQMFLSTLDKYGVKPTEAFGSPFDPEIHETLGTIEDHSLEPGSVAEVAEAGFTYREKLLRPARVLVTHEK